MLKFYAAERKLLKVESGAPQLYTAGERTFQIECLTWFYLEKLSSHCDLIYDKLIFFEIECIKKVLNHKFSKDLGVQPRNIQPMAGDKQALMEENG